ncbi:hypothetical protein [Bryobacter aggregatus]|uniref:hypothetical protein n=1 Tax=Bryobacter aggregatus TaxID=360054 RepID=UPI0004E121A5|nr:hypothetical protein [Bryobacter aggregatus]
MSFLPQLRKAISTLNPSEVRSTAEQPVAIHLIASQASSYTAMADWLLPPGISPAKRTEASQMIYLAGELNKPPQFDVEIYAEDAIAPADAFIFRRDDPKKVVRQILDKHEQLGLPLARLFQPFREEVCTRLIHKVSLENAGFALATALPNIAPILGLTWAVGEFASDSVILTMNQIRLTFLLGAANDHRVGYGEQRTEIGSIIAGAFGWRAVARELVGKIPMGGGLIPKAAVAYAGTFVVGKSLERYYRLGYKYTRGERRAAYEEAFEKGKVIAGGILDRIKSRKSA